MASRGRREAGRGHLRDGWASGWALLRRRARKQPGRAVLRAAEQARVTPGHIIWLCFYELGTLCTLQGVRTDWFVAISDQPADAKLKAAIVKAAIEDVRNIDCVDLVAKHTGDEDEGSLHHRDVIVSCSALAGPPFLARGYHNIAGQKGPNPACTYQILLLR